jgi:hypothetical protein
MNSNEVASMKFFDIGTSQEGIAIVRRVDGNVALCISLQEDGDLETHLPLEVARLLGETLLKATQ